jgi:hypothetical protein
MQKDLVAISTAVSKGKTITTEPEMKETAEKLHDELQTANSTVGELSDHAGIRPGPIKSWWLDFTHNNSFAMNGQRGFSRLPDSDAVLDLA